MDRSVRLENLMVSHFLAAMDRLADPSLLQFVKHLQSRAQGEVRAMFAHLRTVRSIHCSNKHTYTYTNAHATSWKQK